VKSVRQAVGGSLRWIGRERGSAARHCLDELLDGKRPPRRIATDHRGVAEAVKNGWADAGVCHRLVSEHAGLDFLPVRDEAYDLCIATEMLADPRALALLDVVRSIAYRGNLSALPGYVCRDTGSVEKVN
jgi:molybdate-binding protein